MSVKLIQDRFESYHCRSALEEEQAIREITQEVALAALGRTDFFKCAALHGGTCLRVFYGLNRFSEDLDFMLKERAPEFALGPHVQAIGDELHAYGFNIEVVDRSRSDITVRKAFLKDDSIGKVLRFNYAGQTGPLRKIRIKLEVDTNPPSGSGFEVKYLDFPFVCSIVVQDRPSLFAGKVHALLCREYVKGRDWYDFIWYAGRNVGINYGFLASALRQVGPWQGQDIHVDIQWVVRELERRIVSLDWRATVEDVRRFVRVHEQPSLDLWGADFFLSLLDKLR
jgi:hypothetical protein